MLSVESLDSSVDSLTEIDPTPLDDYPDVTNVSSPDPSYDSLPEQPIIDPEVAEGNDYNTTIIESLPPLPVVPSKPPELDMSLYKDKEILKQARKEHLRLTKLYERARKEHDLTLKEREKLVEKLSKKKQRSVPSTHETESIDNFNNPTASQGGNQTQSSASTPTKASAFSPTPQLVDDNESKTSIYSASETASMSIKPPKDRVFCALPGSSDQLWVRIFMPDIDEVVAHQSIFVPNGLYYEWLVNDTAARIEQWVQDDSTRRVIWEQFREI